MSYTLIKNGHLYDHTNNLEGQYDVLLANGIIKEVSENIKACDEYEVFDASGLLVCPGLIDFHVHCYQYATPLGINADETCLLKGVTTVVDAGSAGASTFPGLKKYVMENSKTRVKAFLHIANHGMAAAGCTGVEKGGECDSLNQVNIAQAIECMKQYPDDIIGFKVRLAEAVCNDGKTEVEVFRRALEASKLAQKPLMVHHAFSSIPVENAHHTCAQMEKDWLTCPGSLKCGDVYTHTYHSSIVEDGTVHPEYVRARQRGVVFDVGHGGGSFDWGVADICVSNKFWPDIISSDLHTSSCSEGPAYDLTTVMSKLLHLGMPVSEIIKAVTFTPAKIMQMQNLIGALSTGMNADVTILKIVNEEFLMEDCHKNMRLLKKRIQAVAVWRAGVMYHCI